MQSGSVLNPWAYYNHQDHVSELFESGSLQLFFIVSYNFLFSRSQKNIIAKKLGKDLKTFDELLDFLKTIDSKTFLETTVVYGYTPGNARKDIPLLYAPITEGINSLNLNYIVK